MNVPKLRTSYNDPVTRGRKYVDDFNSANRIWLNSDPDKVGSKKKRKRRSLRENWVQGIANSMTTETSLNVVITERGTTKKTTNVEAKSVMRVRYFKRNFDLYLNEPTKKWSVQLHSKSLALDAYTMGHNGKVEDDTITF